MGDLRTFIPALCALGILTMPLTGRAQQTLAEPAPVPTLRPLRLELGTGYDLFSHQYRVLSTDTSTTTSEGNVHLNLLWSPFANSDGGLELGNRFFAGREYTWNSLAAGWRHDGWQGPGGSAELRWETKRFHDGELSYANDHQALFGTLRGVWRGSGQTAVRTRLHAETWDYEHHTGWLYDTRSIQGVAAVRTGDWFGPWGELEVAGRRQGVPDSTVLNRSDLDLRVTGGWVWGNGHELELVLTAGRRDYPEEGPRPDGRHLGGELTGRLSSYTPWGGWITGYLDRSDYARQTLVYNDATDLRLAAGPVWRPADAWEVRFGAGIAGHRATTFTDTSYVDIFGVTRIADSWTQPFLSAELNIMTIRGFWAFITLEGGRRDYTGSTDWDSDFLYLDLSAMAEIPLARGLALQVLANITPERHREPDDNTVTNYLSVDLLYRLR